jgi:hypothetical protein
MLYLGIKQIKQIALKIDSTFQVVGYPSLRCLGYRKEMAVLTAVV